MAISYLKDYNLTESDVIYFKQPVYAQGNSGNLYLVGQEVSAKEVTEQALAIKGAWGVKAKPAPVPTPATTTKKSATKAVEI
jgi:hypothetical protein